MEENTNLSVVSEVIEPDEWCHILFYKKSIQSK